MAEAPELRPVQENWAIYQGKGFTFQFGQCDSGNELSCMDRPNRHIETEIVLKVTKCRHQRNAAWTRDGPIQRQT